MEQKVKIKAVGKYNGHNIKNNKSVDLNLIFGYDELANCVQLTQLLNENIEVAIKVEDGPIIKIGSFMINQININHDGETKLRLNSMLDYVEADNITGLVGETFKTFFKATIDVEDEEEEDEEV